jgi:uncharacterized integral membrane protein (TIGR00697 family)
MPLATLDERNTKKILIALSLYLASLFAANTLGLKIMPFIWGLHVSVGIFFFPFVILTLDVIAEVYGKRMAKFFVLAGFVATVLFILYSFLSIALPWAPAGDWVHPAYNTVFGISIRIAIASALAFVIGEYQDVVVFFLFRDWLRPKFGTRFFWLRSNLSNLWSQFLDTVIFMTIAFYGIYATPLLINLIISWWLFKVAAGILGTPLSYLGIRILRGESA